MTLSAPTSMSSLVLSGDLCQTMRKRAISGRDTSRRPLYLNAKLKARVDVDGPALRVRSSGQAEARYPLYRVSRVIANTRVDWSAAALQVCLEAGIPIIIVAGSGSPLGAVHPARLAASRLASDVDELLDRPDWREIYDNWLRAARMRMVGEWRVAREGTGKPVASSEWKELVRRFVYCSDNVSPFEETAGIWHGALCALVAGTLRRAGLQSAYWGSGGEPLRLLDDLTRLLKLRLRLEIKDTMEIGLFGEAVSLRVLHAMMDKLDEQCDWLLASFARRVKQVLAEWH